MSNETYLDAMPPEDFEYSIASQIAYDYYDNDNDAEKTQEILDTYLEGYKFDEANSYNDASTIVRPNGSVILAFRGTRPTNPVDLAVDAGIMLGTHRSAIPAPSFIQAQNHYDQVKGIYNDVDLTGHSRGSTWANYIGRANNEKTVIFNPGETPFGLNYGGSNKTTVYKTNTFDLVSFSTKYYSDYNDVRIIPQSDPKDSWLGSHNLTNFLPNYEMLPLSSEPDTIIPIIPTKLEAPQKLELKIPNKEREIEFDKNQRFISNLCLEQPFLFECKKIKLKIKNKKIDKKK